MLVNQSIERYVIDPRDYRKDRMTIGLLIPFCLIWISLTAFMTVAALTEPSSFFFIWLIFGYMGTLLIPYMLVTRNRKHILEVEGESLVVYGTGFLPGSRVDIRKQDFNALTLEHYDDGFDRDSILYT